MGTTGRAAKADDAADVFVMICNFAMSYGPDAEAVASTFQGVLHGAARDCGSVEVTVPTRRVGGFYRALGFDATTEFYKRKL